jgi:hypothetical protein
MDVYHGFYLGSIYSGTSDNGIVHHYHMTVLTHENLTDEHKHLFFFIFDSTN